MVAELTEDSWTFAVRIDGGELDVEALRKRFGDTPDVRLDSIQDVAGFGFGARDALFTVVLGFATSVGANFAYDALREALDEQGCTATIEPVAPVESSSSEPSSAE